MSWIDDLNSAQDVGSVYRYQPTPQPKQKQPEKKKGRGGFLTSLISEAGGLSGAAGGAALGTALLPGIGTLIGAGLGGFFGGTGGRLAENKVRDDEYRLGDALKEGAMSGVMGAGPLRAGKAVIGAAKGKIGGATLSDALKEAGTKATQGSVRGAVGNKLTQASNDLVIKDFRLTPTQVTNFKKKYGEDPSQVIKKYNLTGKDSEGIRQGIIQPLQQEFDTIGGKIPAISTDTIRKSFEKKYTPLLGSAVEDNKAVGQQLKGQADAILKKYGPEIQGSEVAALRREFDSLVSYADKAANPARYNVNKRAADTLRSVLQDTADKVGLKSTDGKTFKEVGRELNKLHQLTDNIARQENVGRGSLPLGITNLLGGGVGSTMGPAGAVGGILMSQAVNSPTGRKVMAKGAQAAGSRLTKNAQARNPYSLKQIASRILPAAGLGAALSQESLDGNSAANPMANSTSSAPPMNANMMSRSYQNSGSMSSPNPAFDPANLEQNIAQIIANGGSMKDVGDYMGLVQTMTEMQTVPQQKPLSAESAKVVSNAQSGIQSLDALESMLAENPNVLRMTSVPGRGVAGGLLGNALGTAGYDNLSRNILDVITRLRTGAALTASEEQFYKKQLPQAFDSPDVIQQKLGMFRDLFGSVVQKTGQGGTDQATLMAALSGV